MTEDFHQMYRGTTLGNTLQESLDEMLDHKLIQPQIAMKIMKRFDQSICTALSTRVKTQFHLRGFLNSYRNCDNVWTLVLNNVEIKDNSNSIRVDKMKIVACEGKHSKNASNQQAQQATANLSRGAAVFHGSVLHGDPDVVDDRSDDDGV